MLLKRPTLLTSQERSDITSALKKAANEWPAAAASRALRLHDRLFYEIDLGPDNAEDLKAA